RHVRHVPGRKTDVKDCQWLQRLHSFELLSASFRPEDMICRLPSLQRHRLNLVSTAGAEIQHMQKALQQMNLHLHHVVSDITGVSGLRIIDAILAGQRDANQLAKLRDHRVYKSTLAQMEAALVGDYRPEHLFVLGQSLQPTASTRLEPKSATLRLRATSNNWPSGSNRPVRSEPSYPSPKFLTARRSRPRSLQNAK